MNDARDAVSRMTSDARQEQAGVVQVGAEWPESLRKKVTRVAKRTNYRVRITPAERVLIGDAVGDPAGGWFMWDNRQVVLARDSDLLFTF